MRKTHCISILRSIRATRSRFLAILVIVALGVGFLSGLLSSPVDMRDSADAYYDASHMYDLQVVSTLGLTAGDLAAVRGVQGVEAVMPAKDTDMVLLARNGDTYTARVQTLPEGSAASAPASLNRLVLLKGRMPSSPGECVVVRTKSMTAELVHVGDRLTPDPADKDLAKDVPAAFTVVGIVRTPVYLSLEKDHTTVGNGTIGLVLYTPMSSFRYDYDTVFYVTVAGARGLNSFDAAYRDRIAAVMDRLKALQPVREKAREEEIAGNASSTLKKVESQYDAKKTQAAAGFAAAQEKLDQHRRQIEQNTAALTAARQQIDRAQKALKEREAQADTTISSTRKRLAAGSAELAVSENQVADGEKALAAAREDLSARDAQITTIEQGKEQLWKTAGAMGMDVSDTSDAKTVSLIDTLTAMDRAGTLPSAWSGPIRAMLPELAALRSGLVALRAQGTTTEESRAAVTAAAAELDARAAGLAAARKTLEDKRTTLDASAAAFDATVRRTHAALTAADAELAGKRVAIAAGAQKLAVAQRELTEGQKKLDAAKTATAAALMAAQRRITEAETRLRTVGRAEWYLWDRDGNLGYASYDANAQKIGNIAKVFPAFFFLVAALVALTTMTRMVEEERLQIGTLKALGYTRWQIAAKYILYALAASVSGSIIGMLVGMKLFPHIIIQAYNIMYDVPRILTPYNLFYGLIASAVAIGCTLAATGNACRSTLREVPARLMLPRAPAPGRRILLEYIAPFWRRMSFTQKVTARNLFRYKKRFFMTIAGIAGCTALLVTGFGLRDSISDIVGKQFNELDRYQLVVALKNPDALKSSKLRAILQERSQIAGSLPVLEENSKVVPQKGTPADQLVIFVPEETGRLGDFFCFRHRTDRKPVVFDEHAVVISEKLAERQHLAVGGTITVQGPDGTPARFVVTGICENYIYHYLFISASTYKKAFGQRPQPNMLLCKLPPAVNGTPAEETLSTELLHCPDIDGTQSMAEVSFNFQKSLVSIDRIVFVLIVSAAALAFVVLYNLTNINIAEREKEIATIKVLGFYDQEISAYVYRETSILTLIGTMFGLVFGIFLHQFVIRTAEVDLVMFGRSIYAPSYCWAALLTLAFSAAVSLVMYRKLQHISMVESMKAPE